MRGQLEAANKDSIRIQVDQMKESKRIAEGPAKERVLSWENEGFPQVIPTADVLHLIHHGSQKKRKRRDGWGGTGALLMVAGLATAANAIWISDKNASNTLLYVGGGQFFGGLTLALTNVSKKRFLRNHPDPWGFE